MKTEFEKERDRMIRSLKRTTQFVGVGGGWIYARRPNGALAERPWCQGWDQIIMRLVLPSIERHVKALNRVLP